MLGRVCVASGDADATPTLRHNRLRPDWYGSPSPRFHIFRYRWRCRACRRVYTVGLVLWPATRAGNFPRGGGRPPDTFPSVLQCMQMREILGLIRQQSCGWHQEVNLICICGADEDTDHTPDCPLADANRW